MSSPRAPLQQSALHARLFREQQALLLHQCTVLGTRAPPGLLIQRLEAFSPCGTATSPQAAFLGCRTPPGLDLPGFEPPACPLPLELQQPAPSRHSLAAARGATRGGFSETARLSSHKASSSPRSSVSTQTPGSTESSPRARSIFGSDGSRPVSPAERGTTLVFRKLPKSCLRDKIAALMDNEGFSGAYDLIYCPMDFATRAGLGYAFVNAVTEEDARRMRERFDGFNAWSTSSTKGCEVSWSKDIQGLDAHLERYRNSPVMHEQVPDAFKPALFRGGQRVAFPEPTKALKMPRLRASRQKLKCTRRMAGNEALEIVEANDA